MNLGIGLSLQRPVGAEYGPERVTNGLFAADTNWTKEAGWTIAAGVASYSTTGVATVLRQANVFDTIGAQYYVEIVVASVNASNFVVYSGTTNVLAATTLITSVSGTGLFSGLITSYVDSLVIRGGVSTVGTVDSISVRKVLR